MVLNGSETGFSPPFDASLYGASDRPTTDAQGTLSEYDDCEAVGAFYHTSPDVEEILPEGVEPYGDPPIAGVMITSYPFSTLGEYREQFTLIQVEDVDGEMAYYIPYIYVTNDAALAAGREVAGAPKKLAEIEIHNHQDVYQGVLERPENTRLLRVGVKPEKRGTMGMMDEFMPSPTPLLGLRHVPDIDGDDGVTQLVEWYADIQFHTDESGEEKLWRGPVDVAYPAESSLDPVHRVPVESKLLGTYSKFDMELGVERVQKEY